MKQGIGLLLIAIGFLAVLEAMLQGAVQGSASYGGVILIGPIPIGAIFIPEEASRRGLGSPKKIGLNLLQVLSDRDMGEFL